MSLGVGTERKERGGGNWYLERRTYCFSASSAALGSSFLKSLTLINGGKWKGRLISKGERRTGRLRRAIDSVHP